MGRWLLKMPVLFVAIVLWVALCGLCSGRVYAASCVRGDFVAVVDEAASALRDLNQANTSSFQERLRALKAKNGWDQNEYLKGAEPYVRDEQIADFDAMSTKLLGEIAAMGHEGSEAASPDCAVLSQLRGRMDVLVTTQKKKWTYMFGKIDGVLGE